MSDIYIGAHNCFVIEFNRYVFWCLYTIVI